MEEKVLLMVIGAVITAVSSLFVWGVKSCVSALITNTSEVKKFREDIQSIKEDLKAIPKLKEDVNFLHSWRRETKEGKS